MMLGRGIYINIMAQRSIKSSFKCSQRSNHASNQCAYTLPWNELQQQLHTPCNDRQGSLADAVEEAARNALQAKTLQQLTELGITDTLEPAALPQLVHDAL